ncbi:LacI family DNA-binding transcriptional regulator [Microbacterium capsulatum]|uniref:LacI family DNA-binding transcriptional regulator n=1 Tax=Microbacterium capsulatum TaxID=3041921 RepID=A0ABU0XEC1_9MICO|nr:LacI family DNA-binding transcriptional regulator [Microbacterium sp. ASV81]MDQ4213467.1 LacI family DNA-binding transcriptional regulator [Microbacterium sp. ASV81]
MTERPRLKDVAERAGVSQTTASHAFSGRRPVSAATKAAVLKAAFDLGFVMEGGTGQRTVGLLLRPPEAIPGFASGSDTFTSVAGAVLVALLGAGFSVSSFLTLDDIGAQVGRLDAFVLLHPRRGDEVLRALIQRGIPTVTLDPDPGDAEFPWWIGTDYAANARTLLDHLLTAGARRPALIVGSTQNTYMESIAGVYVQEMRSRGLPVLVREVEPVRAQQGGAAAAESLLRIPTPPDAFLTSTDLFAVGAIDAVQARGLRVPDDVLVANMMDSVIAELAVVPITAMKANMQVWASQLTRLLQRRLSSGAPLTSHLLLEFELVQRASTRRRSPQG